MRVHSLLHIGTYVLTQHVGKTMELFFFECGYTAQRFMTHK